MQEGKQGKSTSVRIPTKRYNELSEIAESFGSSVNKLTERAVAHWLNDEGAIWREKAAEIKALRG